MLRTLCLGFMLCAMSFMVFAEDAPKQISLKLNAAIKAYPQAQSRAKQWPIYLDFVLQNGQVTGVYAWSPWQPSIVPDAKLISQKASPNGWELVCTLQYPDDMPIAMGGQITIKMQLERNDDSISGNYQASLTPTDINLLKDALRKSGLKSFSQVKYRLIEGKTQSITQLAKRLPGGVTRAEPIIIEGELRDADPLLLLNEVPHFQVGQAPQVDADLLALAQKERPHSIVDVRLAYRETYRLFEQNLDREAYIKSSRLTDLWLMHAVGESGAISKQKGTQAVLDLLALPMQARIKANLIRPEVAERWAAITSWRTSTAPLLYDRQLGRIVLQSQGKHRFKTTFNFSRQGKQAAHLRGQWTLGSFGQGWLNQVRPTKSAGYTSYETANVLRLIDAPKSAEKAAFPTSGGYLHRMRVYKNGISIAMKAHGFEERSRNTKKRVDGAYSWKTLGVDMSGKSGAPYVAVVVEGVHQAGKREQLWQLNIGKLGEEEVEARFRQFSIKPKNSKLWLKGTIVYPETARVRYHPETGMLIAKLKGEQTSTQQLLEQRINKLMGEASHQEMAIPIALEEEEELTIGEDHWAMFNKLLKHTSSNKMGGGDRVGRAMNSVVVVLTLQESEKEAPKLEVEKQLDAFLKLGPQTITYTEYLLGFE